MPVIAIAGAISGATALATVGATALGTFGTISALGGIVAGVGAITGNKTLMRIGAVAGLAGGIGAFGQSQGWFGEAAAASTGYGTGAGLDEPVSSLSSDSAGLMSAGSNTAVMGAGAVDVSGMGGGTAGLPNMSTTDTLGNVADAGINGSAFKAPTTQAPLPGAGGAKGTFAQSIAPAANSTPANSMVTAPTSATPTSRGIMDMLKDFGKFANDNKELTTIGANFIGGMFDDTKKALGEKTAAEADYIRNKIVNGSAVPRYKVTANTQTPVVNSPAYNRPSGLWYAR